MSFVKPKEKKMCIICRKRKKEKGSLFCKKCSHKDIFTKIKFFRKSAEYKGGWLNLGEGYHYGKLHEHTKNEYLLNKT